MSVHHRKEVTLSVDLKQRPRVSPNSPLLPDVVLSHVWVVPGVITCEVAEVACSRALSDTELRLCWAKRLKGRATPLLLFQECEDQVAICGPDGDSPQVVRLPTKLAEMVLREVLSVPPAEFVSGYLALLRRVRGSAGVPGLRNQQLFGTHYLCKVLPRIHRDEWAEWTAKARSLRGTSGRALFQGLGFQVRSSSVPRELLLEVGNTPVAVVHLYDAHVNLDRMVRSRTAAGDGVQPAAAAINAAQRAGVDYAFIVSGSVVRLHVTRLTEVLEETAATAAYLELDLSLIPDDFVGILWACFSAEALGPDGHVERLFREGQRYTVGLRYRFQERVYEEVVPSLVRGLWQADPTVDPDLLYRATLTLLFRLLFVLYAEDRNLLPVDNPRYAPFSLTNYVEKLVMPVENAGHAHSTHLWDALRRIFAAIHEGNREWGIPAYDGGLFATQGSPEVEFLSRVKLTDDVLIPAIRALAVDRQGEEEGKVDFGDLGVRHLGTIYEGLLSYRVLIADTDLAISGSGPNEAYVPAQQGQRVVVRAGEPYIVSPQGGRKASGSYYTPQFAVDRLVKGALDPVLDRHFARLDALDEDACAEAFFDIKICDPSMGSGHFLTRALDYLADKLQSYLAQRPLPKIADQLERARMQVASVGQQYGIPDLADGTSDFDLLRRLVLKRCIYGVDELAKLSLWLRSFVPGLPLSYLDHNLQCGDSLVGVAGPEIKNQLESASVAGWWISHTLEQAFDQAKALGSLDDLELHEIEQAREIQRQISECTAAVREVYDAFVAHRFSPNFDWELYLQVVAARQVGDQFASDHSHAISRDATIPPWTPFHWQLAFPEVFLRDAQGFDAVIGNPPWEEVTVEETGFFVQYIPGLKGIRSAAERTRRIKDLISRHPNIQSEYEAEKARTAQLRCYLKNAYELTKSGDPDLYRAFAERFLQILSPRGSLGVVLPRTAFSAEGIGPFRERLFGPQRFIKLDFLRNTGGWVFADAEPRYTITLVLSTYNPEAEATVISVAGPVDSQSAFESIDSVRVCWTVGDLKKVSDGLEVPLIPDYESAKIFRRLCEVHPRFDSQVEGFKPVPWAELHATHDRNSGLIREEGPGWPVYTGDSIDLWDPDHQPPSYFIDPDEGLAYLHHKRQRSPVWRKNFALSVIADPKTLPHYSARILFRDVARNNDSRTVRACLVPPRVFAMNQAPSLLFPTGSVADQIYVLGIMCSIPFDWVARRRVESHVNFFILNSLPMPRLPKSSPIYKRIVTVAGRLACPDERFADVAREIGVEYGPLSPQEKQSLIAELDALSAVAYGLSEDELVKMFEDFPMTDAGVSKERRDAILDHFRRLRGQGS